MGIIKKFKSIVDETITEEIEGANWHSSLSMYATYKCGVEGIIAAAYLLCPEIIQIKDYIFIREFWNTDSEEKSLIYIKQLEKQYNYNKKAIEMRVNSWSVGDFFYVGEGGKTMNNERVVMQFANVLVHFWKQRVRELFPNREIIVELGYGLAGELGLSITMYQADQGVS